MRILNHPRRLLLRIMRALGALGLASILLGAASPPAGLILADKTEIPLKRFPATGHALILWLPSEVGQTPEEADLAVKLAKMGTEVWLADLLDARFLPPLASSLAQIPASDVVALITDANKTGKSIYLLASGHGATTVLAGAHAWAQQHPHDHTLAGAILLYPNLYAGTPDAGETARYLPVVRQTRLPILIFQPEQSAERWWLDNLKTELQKGGAKVYVHFLPNVRDRFYFRVDTTAIEDRTASEFPQLLEKSLAQLNSATGNHP